MARDRASLVACREVCAGTNVPLAISPCDVILLRAHAPMDITMHAHGVPMLGVSMALINGHGAVSEPVARAMAEGALAHSDADLSVAVTGVAGPGGGTAEKPVGLVHLACARRGGETLHVEQRYGDLGRGGIREATVRTAFEMLARQLE